MSGRVKPLGVPIQKFFFGGGVSVSRRTEISGDAPDCDYDFYRRRYPDLPESQAFVAVAVAVAVVVVVVVVVGGAAA